MFVRSEEYYQRTINNIKTAIAGTETAIKSLSCRHMIDAHNAQINSYKKLLGATEAEYAAFKNLPPDCSDCETRKGICHASTKRGSKTCLKIRVQHQ